MTTEQVEIFIRESKEKNIEWGRINILGGEPTLHPDILEILTLLVEYKQRSSHCVDIQLFTNGYGHEVAGALSKIPDGVVIVNSKKTGVENEHCLFNNAPKDSILYRCEDFSNGCYITSTCGIGLTPYGYYCCAIAGGIDRVFGFDIGRKKLPPADDGMVDQLGVFCELCGHFLSIHQSRRHTREAISPVWKEAYKKYSKQKPVLSLYSSE